jgi:hypothetical protein
MKYYAVAVVCALLVSLPIIAQKVTDGGAEDRIRIVAVDPTPEAESAVMAIQLPHDGKVIAENPVWMQIRVDGYVLGSDSQFDRKNEVANSDLGQTIHVIIDNEPYFAINGPSVQPFNEEGFYYSQSYKFEVPFKIKEGFHTIRAFPTRSYGESLKGDRMFQTGYFYVGKETSSTSQDLFSRPYLTYNEPSNRMNLVESKPLLLDFYVSNCELSSDGYKVRLTIDGKVQRTFVSWRPYYIYGLKRGKHTLRLELIDEKNKMVPSSYNDIQQTVVIH